MARRNPKAGEGPCPICSRSLFFRVNPSGKLAYSCDGCDSSGFADAGGEAARRWQASITTPAEPPAPAAAPAAPAPAPTGKGKAPAPAPARAAFGFGAL